ncbi:hypothetical protein PY093_13785 [Cytobacillus sp. S13-E01]|uniref:hypothetical protein n=1 Tax=Cytobacillus sp. S13-E01 TaxID=3031326 RepID=UPI0023D7C22D|nr:hypothetical protein [Cytobacillus sp. S13-E01]MDF0727745.1 hypothetical protein [Cytobacillus sp. S13-E01]
MINSTINIGEHYFHVNSNSINVMRTIINEYTLCNDLNIQSNMNILINEGFGVPFLNYDVTITKNKNLISYCRADYLIQVDSNFKYAEIYVHDDLALQHAFLNLYSSFIVHINWGLLIHSSCVIDNGKGHIFSGHSGAGKSTAAKLSHPRSLLSDEATLVKISPKEIIIYDSPFRSEIKIRGNETLTSLGSIQLLKQSQQNKRTILKKADALLRLIDKVFFWTNDSIESKQIIQLLQLLVQNVPAYELQFQKNDTFWELIS